MNQMLSFWVDWLDAMSDFLTSEPAIWFVGLYVGFFILQMIFRIVHMNDNYR